MKTELKINKKLSIVIPVFNESQMVFTLQKRLEAAVEQLPCSYEIIFVDDGSYDDTSDQIKEWIGKNDNIVLLQLSRNFGHQAAITAGLKESKGDGIVIIDADLQDPPELILQMVQKWREGFQIVLAERTARSETFFRRFLFESFYKMFHFLTGLTSVTSGVYGLMDRVVVNQLLRMKEQNRFIPGLRHWVGFKSTQIWYDREERVSGKPKQSFYKLLKYGCDAIFSFSHRPLRLSLFVGLFVSVLCIGYGILLFVQRILQINIVPGFTTIAVGGFFLGSMILISNGIMGEYLGRIYDEVKERPLFIVAKKFYRGPGDKNLKEEDGP